MQERLENGIACIGAGPAGLYFAILAKQAVPERRVTVYERQQEGASHGWGVVFPDELLQALDATDPTTGQRMRERAFRWQDQIVHVQGRQPIAIPSYGFSLGRRTLLEILVGRARELGVELCFEHEIKHVSAVAEDDLIVAGDGVHSMLRAASGEVFGTHSTRGINKYIWLGTNRVFRSFEFPFVETQAGWLWAHAYGFDDTTSTFIVETSNQTWTQLGFDALPPDETMRRLEALFAPWLDGHPLCCPPGGAGTAPWREFECVTNARWHAGKLVLLGDAAHTTHFTIGSGTRLALEDAISLAAQLRTHDALPAALAAYERERSAALQRVQLDARCSARWFENVPRYIDRDAQQFADLLDRRCSSVMPHVPPGLFLRLRTAAHLAPFVTQPMRHVWRAVQQRR